MPRCRAKDDPICLRLYPVRDTIQNAEVSMAKEAKRRARIAPNLRTDVKIHPDSKIVNDLISRIVSAAHPIRIILFGSAARGEMNPNSDIDVMVVMPEGTHRLNTTQYLYKRMLGFGYPVDIVVTTPSILEQHKNNIGLIYRTVLAEGKEVYAS
jgi:predicted nucleotidyltransferase